MTTNPIANLGTALANAAALAMLANAPAIVDTYAGRRGCMCGCKGTYSDAPATVKRRLADVRRIVESGNAESVEVFGMEPGDTMGAGFCLDYFTDAGAEKRIALYTRK